MYFIRVKNKNLNLILGLEKKVRTMKGKIITKNEKSNIDKIYSAT